MCGRFTLTVDEDTILIRFNSIKVIDIEHKKRYNIAPTQSVLAIVNDGEQNRLGRLRWGLIPSWAKDMKIGYKMINARAETLAEKPAFKHAFRRQRCIIPADGFYEWKQSGKEKQPFRIKLKSDEVFGFAGLWDRWQSPDGTVIHTCTIVTTQANDLLADLHHRMPVILRKEDEKLWLDRKVEDPHVLQDLLQPYPADEMEVYPVSSQVNSAKYDDPSLILSAK
jgi:putative SOS response-associated peptidase YedK